MKSEGCMNHSSSWIFYSVSYTWNSIVISSVFLLFFTSSMNHKNTNTIQSGFLSTCFSILTMTIRIQWEKLDIYKLLLCQKIIKINFLWNWTKTDCSFVARFSKLDMAVYKDDISCLTVCLSQSRRVHVHRCIQQNSLSFFTEYDTSTPVIVSR